MNRRERRRANRGKPKVKEVIEVFSTPNLGDGEIHLDVGRMRLWAEGNVELQKIKIDVHHVMRLVEGGTVTRDRIEDYTIKHAPRPILVCEHPDGQGDEIVDGNHTYVASALGWAEALERGLVSREGPPFVLGYGLTPEQWRPFVVPSSLLRRRKP